MTKVRGQNYFNEKVKSKKFSMKNVKGLKIFSEKCKWVKNFKGEM